MHFITRSRHQASALPGFVQVLQQEHRHQRRQGLQIQHFLHLKWVLWLLPLLGMLCHCQTTNERIKQTKTVTLEKKKQTQIFHIDLMTFKGTFLCGNVIVSLWHSLVLQNEKFLNVLTLTKMR